VLPTKLLFIWPSGFREEDFFRNQELPVVAMFVNGSKRNEQFYRGYSIDAAYHIEEEQTTQWPKEKVQKDKQRSTKHTYKTLDRVKRTPSGAHK
jgi:hypothetical protein